MAQHTPIAEQKRLVAEWRGAQQSICAFARNAGIHPNTFWSWTKKYGSEEVSLTPRPAFVDITPEPVPASAGPVSVTVRPSASGRPGCELDFSVLPPPTWFAAMARKLATC